MIENYREKFCCSDKLGDENNKSKQIPWQPVI